jgi:hypothetical protein
MVQVIKWLLLVHERGITHRDIKPDYILVMGGDMSDAKGFPLMSTIFNYSQAESFNREKDAEFQGVKEDYEDPYMCLSTLVRRRRKMD